MSDNGLPNEVWDALDVLNDINAEGNILYEDYVRLHNAITSIVLDN